MKNPQTRKEKSPGRGGESPAHCTGASWGTRPIPGKECDEEEALGFLTRKKPKMGEEKNVTLSLLKAEVWGAYYLKCKNTGEPPQKFRGKSRDSLREGNQVEKLFRWNPANSRLSSLFLGACLTASASRSHPGRQGPPPARPPESPPLPSQAARVPPQPGRTTLSWGLPC